MLRRIRQNQIHICNKRLIFKETNIIFILVTLLRRQRLHILQDTFFCDERWMVFVKNLIFTHQFKYRIHISFI